MRFRSFAIAFALAYAITYVISVLNNYALFTYHPAIGEFGAGVQKGRDGPAMYWFGWLATSGIVACAAGAVAAVLPESATRRLAPGLIWVVALIAMAVLAYDLRQFFLK
jgi:hypothetical protein